MSTLEESYQTLLAINPTINLRNGVRVTKKTCPEMYEENRIPGLLADSMTFEYHLDRFTIYIDFGPYSHASTNQDGSISTWGVTMSALCSSPNKEKIMDPDLKIIDGCGKISPDCEHTDLSKKVICKDHPFRFPADDLTKLVKESMLFSEIEKVRIVYIDLLHPPELNAYELLALEIPVRKKLLANCLDYEKNNTDRVKKSEEMRKIRISLKLTVKSMRNKDDLHNKVVKYAETELSELDKEIKILENQISKFDMTTNKNNIRRLSAMLIGEVTKEKETYVTNCELELKNFDSDAEAQLSNLQQTLKLARETKTQSQKDKISEYEQLLNGMVEALN